MDVVVTAAVRVEAVTEGERAVVVMVVGRGRLQVATAEVETVEA